MKNFLGLAMEPFGSLAEESARCPLYAQKRTFMNGIGMSALGQKRTHAVQQKGLLFDHLVGAREQRRRHGEAERLGGGQVHDEIKFGRLLNRDIAGLFSP